jgi:surface polysaccharide O-acyltransferase-like enzyme
MQKQYNIAIDSLRILATLAVLLIHTTILFIQIVNHDIQKIPFTFFLNQIAVFAVPLFFLISGFVLELNYKELNYKVYFKKRAAKIIIPYIFWSLFYFLAYPNKIPSDTSFWWLLITGKAAYQLYFIPSIILFYLLFPLFHKYYFLISHKIILGTLLIIEIFLQTIDYYYGPFSIGNALRATLLSFVLFPLGMVLSHNEERMVSFTKRHLKKLVISLFFLAILIPLQSWYYYLWTGNAQAIYSQYNLFVIPYTLLIALFSFYLFPKSDTVKKTIVKLSNISFFVFFIHVAIIYTFGSFIESLFIQSQTYYLGSAILSMLFFFFVTSMSFLLADFFHRIPKLSKLTG